MFEEGKDDKMYLRGLVAGVVVLVSLFSVAVEASQRPNILLAISDDQSYLHTSRHGASGISTPAFDRIAREGMFFRNAIAGSPGCSPSRASLLTGRYPWQNEQAGTHASSFPAALPVYPELLQQAGYHIGYTGKPWGPGNWKISGREQNPAGPAVGGHLAAPPGKSISNKDYAKNFETFLSQCQPDQPFCFWFGAHEPHRAFEPGIGLRLGKDPAEVTVPEFLPDVDVIRSDLLDYFAEIEHFDRHLATMIKTLEDRGQLENTLIVVTSDNGMAFPRAKANCYEYGIHVPLAIRWGVCIQPGQVITDLISFTDLAPTFLEAAGVPIPKEMTGQSLRTLFAEGEGSLQANRDYVFSSRERHSSSRYQNWTYPQRAMRTAQFLLIRNFKPERWPAGAPRKLDSSGALGPEHGGYHDIDACPSLTMLIERRTHGDIQRYFHLAVDKRPAWELYDIKADPACLNNLADQPDQQAVQTRLQKQMLQFLLQTKDPRVLGQGDVWEEYVRYSKIRKFPKPSE